MDTPRKIVISRRRILIALAALAVLAAGAVGVLHGGAALSSVTTVLPFLGGSQIAGAAAQTPATAAAQEVIRAMLTVTDYHDPVSWQQGVNARSTAEGKTAWQGLLDQGWWGAVETQQAVTEQVTFTETREVGEFTSGGRPGRKVRLAGAVRGRNRDGAFERPFSFQVLMVQDAAGQWKFAYFDLEVEQGG